MKGINKAIIVGVVGQDPEISATEQSQVARLSVATNEKWKDAKTGEDKEETEWHKVVFFGQLAGVIGQYVKKGDKLYIEGKIKTKKYTDKEGVERYTTQIVGSSMQMLGGSPQKPQQQQAQPQQNTNQAPPYGEYKRRHAPPPQSKAQQAATEVFYDDVVPF